MDYEPEPPKLMLTMRHQNATPVMVQVTRNARIDIYRGSELLGSQFLTPGMHTLDTHSLPPGSYPLALRIYEDGILRRTESQPFSKGVIASVHRPSGLFRAGRKIPGIKPAIMTVRLSWLPDSELGCGKISV